MVTEFSWCTCPLRKHVAETILFIRGNIVSSYYYSTQLSSNKSRCLPNISFHNLHGVNWINRWYRHIIFCSYPITNFKVNFQKIGQSGGKCALTQKNHHPVDFLKWCCLLHELQEDLMKGYGQESISQWDARTMWIYLEKGNKFTLPILQRSDEHCKVIIQTQPTDQMAAA